MRVEEVSHDPEKPVSRQIGHASDNESHTLQNISSTKHEESASPITFGITETAFQRLIDALPEKPKRSRFWVLAHPLTVALVGSLATALFVGIIGGGIAYLYNKKTQADARRLSLLDGINNARVPKLGELWEQLDVDDLAINQLLDEIAKNEMKRADQDAKLHQIVEILKKDRLLVGRYRFWLGDHFYKQSDEYLDRTIQICLSTLGDNNPDLTELRQQKDAARQDIIKIRDLFLEGNSNY